LSLLRKVVVDASRLHPKWRLFPSEIRFITRRVPSEADKDWKSEMLPFGHAPHADLGGTSLSALTYLTEGFDGGETCVLPWFEPYAGGYPIPVRLWSHRLLQEPAPATRRLQQPHW